MKITGVKPIVDGGQRSIVFAKFGTDHSKTYVVFHDDGSVADC